MPKINCALTKTCFDIDPRSQTLLWPFPLVNHVLPFVVEEMEKSSTHIASRCCLSHTQASWPNTHLLQKKQVRLFTSWLREKALLLSITVTLKSECWAVSVLDRRVPDINKHICRIPETLLSSDHLISVKKVQTKPLPTPRKHLHPTEAPMLQLPIVLTQN